MLNIITWKNMRAADTKGYDLHKIKSTSKARKDKLYVKLQFK